MENCERKQKLPAASNAVGSKKINKSGTFKHLKTQICIVLTLEVAFDKLTVPVNSTI